MSKKTNTLIIFVKNPEEGRVKTRLAQTMGDTKALEVYNKLTEYTRKIASEVIADRQVWYSRFIPDDDLWSEDDFEQFLQKGDDLGNRMKKAFASAFESGYEKAVIIGSDCAELSSDIIGEAYKCLDESDVVVGPTQDGGYYLLGMNILYPDLFEEIDWSTPQVLSQTLMNAKNKGLSVQQLVELNDVDFEEDWQSVRDQF